MIRPCGEKDWGRCSNENTEDGSERTPKDGKNKTEVRDVKWKDMKEKGVQREEAHDQRIWTMQTWCADLTLNSEKAAEEDETGIEQGYDRLSYILFND